jgi:glycosyltransferase involved in cell wall biosynthesis
VSAGLNKFNPCVEVIPNCVDFAKWDKLYNSKKENRIRIGWAGSHAHYNDLKVLEKVVKHTTQKYKNVEFMFFGGMPDYLKESSQVKFFNRWYSIDDYPAALAKLGFDIGLAPLRDNLFNRAKSNLRWLEYSALKIPTIASPRSPFKGITNIKLAEEVDDWIANIENLVENEDYRVKLGQDAYNEVKKDFNVEIWAEKYIELLKEIVGGKRKVNVARYDEHGNPFLSK